MSEKEKSWAKQNWWIFIALLALFPVLINASTEFIVFASVTAWIVVPFWLHHKRKIAREQRETQQTQKDPEQELKFQKLQERLENLEALICRLDTEMSQQIERSLSMARIAIAGTSSGVSQMPTNFMHAAAALEGRYQVLKELGRGGMGIVFQAYDKQLNEQVAIKILTPLLSSDPMAIERLKREVSAARRITHPNVIRIHDLSEINGLHFVSMEFFQGMNLKEYLKSNGPLSLLQGWNIVSQICDGLEAAHNQSVIHRDLKSQNVILDSSNRVKIIDFGLARTAHLDGMTATGMILGTPEYMPPEQVSGKTVDERSDIYSLGIILYEVFTGKVPFRGESAIAVGFKQMKEPPPPPTQSNPQLPSSVERVILKALEKNPFQRYRSVAELKHDLQQAIHQPLPATAIDTSTPVAEKEKVRS